MKLLIALLISSQLVGCGLIGKKSTDQNPIVLTECPAELPTLRESATFGDSNLKIIEVAGIYHACRKAACAGMKCDKEK